MVGKSHCVQRSFSSNRAGLSSEYQCRKFNYETRTCYTTIYFRRKYRMTLSGSYCFPGNRTAKYVGRFLTTWWRWRRRVIETDNIDGPESVCRGKGLPKFPCSFYII